MNKDDYSTPVSSSLLAIIHRKLETRLACIIYGLQLLAFKLIIITGLEIQK